MAERTALVKALRAAGERERAAEVAKLRRPSLAEHALNRVALDEPDVVAALLEAIDAVRSAQDAALAGGGRAELRVANEARRRATDDVARHARRVLEADGRPAEAQTAAIGEVLRRVGASAAVAEQLASGRLGAAPVAEDDDPFGGFEAAAAGTPRAPRRKDDSVAKQRRERERALAAAEEALVRARRALMRADSDLDRARSAEADAEDAHAAAQAALADAERRWSDAGESLAAVSEAREGRAAEVAAAEAALAEAQRLDVDQ